MTNLQAMNTSLQATNAQLEQQLRERTRDLEALRTQTTQGTSEAAGAREQLLAEVALLKTELAQSRQTCEESLGLAEALQQTMDGLFQNGHAQEELLSQMRARVQQLELDREELRKAQAAEAQRVREAVAEATAAGEQPTTLEELQERKIVELLAQIAALEGLLRERTEIVSKLNDQQFELARELEKSKKVRAISPLLF
jgi:hypothetical protein